MAEMPNHKVGDAVFVREEQQEMPGAVLRADDGHLRAFRSADRRALDDDIRAWRRRGTPPPPPLDPSPAHNSTHYNQGLRASGL